MLKNVSFIEGNVEQTTQALLVETGISDRFHFTNGTYAAPAELIVPTTLDGFGSLIKRDVAREEDIFVIAVNSDASMQGIMNKKSAVFDQRENALVEKDASAQEFEAFDAEWEKFNTERETLEDQFTRAMKVAAPLAEANPERPIYIVFYDEETPTDLYESLKQAGLNLESLHKHGYGTSKDAPKIEGAHVFNRVIAYPLPNDTKPLCYDITVTEDQSRFIEVVDLSKQEGGRFIYVPQKPQVGSGAPVPVGFA